MIQRKFAVTSALVALLTAAAGFRAAAQKDSFPKPVNKLALGEEQVRQLLPLMECNLEGKISKPQYMKFMEEEFDRLDKEKKGELDVKLLSQPSMNASRYTGK